MLLLASTGPKRQHSQPPSTSITYGPDPVLLRWIVGSLDRPHFLPGLELADPTTRIYTLSIYSATYLDW